MGNERSDVYFAFGQQLQKGFHVAGFRPAHIADWIVAAFLFIRSVVAAGSIGARNAEVEFLFVIGPALNLDADGAHGHDDGALAGDCACKIYGLAAGSFRGDENRINAEAARLIDANVTKFRGRGRDRVSAEMRKEKDLGTYGFLGYPVLQSADILIYKADIVPVGEDQVAHVELTREIARRFNGFYAGKREYVFPEPAALLTPAPRLPGTDGRKMSKSYGNAVMLTDPEPVVRQKLKTMVTDPARIRRTDRGNPDVCPVGDLHKIFSSKETMAKVYEGCRSAGIGCIECKSWAADALVKILNPMQERREKYEDNPRLAWDILEAGSARAREIAGATMEVVRSSMGLDYEPKKDSKK